MIKILNFKVPAPPGVVVESVVVTGGADGVDELRVVESVVVGSVSSGVFVASGAAVTSGAAVVARAVVVVSSAVTEVVPAVGVIISSAGVVVSGAEVVVSGAGVVVSGAGVAVGAGVVVSTVVTAVVTSVESEPGVMSSANLATTAGPSSVGYPNTADEIAKAIRQLFNNFIFSIFLVFFSLRFSQLNGFRSTH